MASQSSSSEMSSDRLLSVVCMGWAGKEVLWSDLDKTASLLHQPAQGVGGGVALQPRAAEWAYTTCPGFRVYPDTRSRGVNLQFSVKCAFKLVNLTTGLSQYIHVGSIKPEQVDINQRGHCWNRVQHKCAVECNRAREWIGKNGCGLDGWSLLCLVTF